MAFFIMNLRTKQMESILPTPLIEYVKVRGVDSPIMIVLDTVRSETPLLFCGWFDKNNQWNTETFSEKILEKVDNIQSPQVPNIKRAKNFNPYIMNESDRERLREYLAKGMKISVIKMYRDLTNEGLKEAKDAVELNWNIWYNMMNASEFKTKNIY